MKFLSKFYVKIKLREPVDFHHEELQTYCICI